MVQAVALVSVTHLRFAQTYNSFTQVNNLFVNQVNQDSLKLLANRRVLYTSGLPQFLFTILQKDSRKLYLSLQVKVEIYGYFFP